MKEVVELLAFLGAMRNYSYIDRVGNAIDEVSVEEALKDALRAYITQCIEGKQECIEVEENIGIKCPDLKVENLEHLMGSILKEIQENKINLLKVSRRIALEAYAAIPRIRKEYACVPVKR